jgi:hypothetical protein
MIQLITIEEATRLASEWVQQNNSFPTDEIVLVEEETITRPYGWFFFYNSKHFLATRDLDYALVGNAPLLVDKRGQVHSTGTAYAIEHYVAEFDSQYQQGELQSQ